VNPRAAKHQSVARVSALQVGAYEKLYLGV
jgi:hypothetical protein